MFATRHAIASVAPDRNCMSSMRLQLNCSSSSGGKLHALHYPHNCICAHQLQLATLTQAGRPHKPPAPRVPIAIKSSWVITCGAGRYIRGLGYNVSDSYTTHTYPYQLQLQIHVTPCVHNIRHKYNMYNNKENTTTISETIDDFYMLLMLGPKKIPLLCKQVYPFNASASTETNQHNHTLQLITYLHAFMLGKKKTYNVQVPLNYSLLFLCYYGWLDQTIHTQ